ncbi:hypothetical protein ACFYRN_19630 [Streptomyces sp. NPDC005227]|uniref:hypothetical protein n=1 Tax=unclassified Streptomyces TaxID=2593676 RepID=UPI00369D55CE
MREHGRAETGVVWAVARSADDRPVGLIGWNDVDLADSSTEIVHWVLPRPGAVAS